MDGPQQPAARDFVLEVVDAFPGGLGAGAVVHPQEETGDALDGHGEAEHAGPDFRPARAVGQQAFAARPHQQAAPDPLIRLRHQPLCFRRKPIHAITALV